MPLHHILTNVKWYTEGNHASQERIKLLKLIFKIGVEWRGEEVRRFDFSVKNSQSEDIKTNLTIKNAYRQALSHCVSHTFLSHLHDATK